MHLDSLYLSLVVASREAVRVDKTAEGIALPRREASVLVVRFFFDDDDDDAQRDRLREGPALHQCHRQ